MSRFPSDSILNLSKNIETQHDERKKQIKNFLLANIFNYDEYTYYHSLRSAAYAKLISSFLKHLTDEEKDGIFIGTLLHDIGKTEIPAIYIKSKQKLPEYQKRIIKQHPTIGLDYVQHLSPIVQACVGLHHERWDGKGYPFGSAASKIPLSARITSLADAFDAILSNRPYNDLRGFEDALAILLGEKGTQFDPYLVGIIFDKHEIFLKYYNFFAVTFGQSLESFVKLEFANTISLSWLQIEQKY